MPLTPKQERFVSEYLIDLNATQAAIRAGYSQRTATMQGARLLTKANVQEAIRLGRAAQQQRLEIEADDVLRELLLIGRSDIGDVLDFTGSEIRLRPANQISERARRAISSFRVRRLVEGSGEEVREVEVLEFKLWDKLSALDKLGKHLGLWRDALDLNLNPPYKVYLGFDPREALGQTPPISGDGPTAPEAPPST